MKRIALYCGASCGTNPKFTSAVEQMVKYIIQSDLGIVFGGGSVGLMGVVGKTASANNGNIVGVIPTLLLEKELACDNLTELLVVDNMHQRKAKMIELAAGFILMPGGAGSAEEFFEAWTWSMLGYINHPSAIYNIDGCYDNLINYIQDMVANGFIDKRYYESLIISDNPENIITKMTNYVPPAYKWG